jgi:hypothetical protein
MSAFVQTISSGSGVLERLNGSGERTPRVKTMCAPEIAHAVDLAAHTSLQQRGSRLVKHHSEEVLCHHCRNEFPDELTNPHIPKLCFPS